MVLWHEAALTATNVRCTHSASPSYYLTSSLYQVHSSADIYVNMAAGGKVQLTVNFAEKSIAEKDVNVGREILQRMHKTNTPRASLNNDRYVVKQVKSEINIRWQNLVIQYSDITRVTHQTAPH